MRLLLRHTVVFPLLAAALSCSSPGEPEDPRLEALPPATREALARDAEQGLRDFGRDVFEVTSFHVGSGQGFTYMDGQNYPVRLYQVDFEARIRFVADVTVRTHEEVIAHRSDPGWTLDEGERDLMRLQVLGPGLAKADSTKTVHMAVFFDKRKDGYRFRTIDRPWRR